MPGTSREKGQKPKDSRHVYLCFKMFDYVCCFRSMLGTNSQPGGERRM